MTHALDESKKCVFEFVVKFLSLGHMGFSRKMFGYLFLKIFKGSTGFYYLFANSP